MPIRLGTFCVLLLMFVSLGINVTFFSDVRESFLGSGECVPSSSPATPEPNIAEFYPQTPPQNAAVTPDPKKESPAKPPVKVPAPIPLPVDSGEPFLQPSAPPPEPPRPVLPPPSVTKSNKADKQAAALPPAPVSAAVKPVVADQFKPAAMKPKPQTVKPSQKPSSNAVWDTADSVSEQPIRYE